LGDPYDGEKADVFALANILFAMKMKEFPAGTPSKIISSKKY
jgi:hypothetical protein